MMAVSSVATAIALPPVVPVIVGLVRSAQLSERRAVEIRSRDEFLSVAAHEFKTPIASLSAYAQLLDRRLDTTHDPRNARAVQVIRDQAGRLTALVESLLDLSRIATGRFHIELVPLPVNDLLRRVVETEAGLHDQHTLTLVEAAKDVRVAGDEHRLEQVLQNLLSNAIKYSPRGGLVTVTLAASNGEAVIAVADEGIGIPPTALPHLFDRFYRAGNTEPRGALPGFGIGLYVVKEIVEQHGGTITVESKENVGSTFTVSIPLWGNDR